MAHHAGQDSHGETPWASIAVMLDLGGEVARVLEVRDARTHQLAELFPRGTHPGLELFLRGGVGL